MGDPKAIAQDVLKQIGDFAEKQLEQQLRLQIEGGYHEFLTLNVAQTARSFSNARLAELAGYVNAEVERRTDPPAEAAG